eukprot:GHRQ01012238.1.p1 GENE.GHRQ01012238.1~~GHRQ01012238.1.p1  ORF type:complete len:144 (+),score=32.90 GHRQ01012238.1:126-557(+)
MCAFPNMVGTSNGRRSCRCAACPGTLHPCCCAGTWADVNCAVSGTGVGEEFIRRAAAHDVAARVQYKGISLTEAMHEVVWQSMSQGDGGFVGVDSDYNCVIDFNSVGMYRAAVDFRGNNVLAVFQDTEQQAGQEQGVQQGRAA